MVGPRLRTAHPARHGIVADHGAGRVDEPDVRTALGVHDPPARPLSAGSGRLERSPDGTRPPSRAGPSDGSPDAGPRPAPGRPPERWRPVTRASSPVPRRSRTPGRRTWRLLIPRRRTGSGSRPAGRRPNGGPRAMPSRAWARPARVPGSPRLRPPRRRSGAGRRRSGADRHARCGGPHGHGRPVGSGRCGRCRAQCHATALVAGPGDGQRCPRVGAGDDEPADEPRHHGGGGQDAEAVPGGGRRAGRRERPPTRPRRLPRVRCGHVRRDGIRRPGRGLPRLGIGMEQATEIAVVRRAWVDRHGHSQARHAAADPRSRACAERFPAAGAAVRPVQGAGPAGRRPRDTPRRRQGHEPQPVGTAYARNRRRRDRGHPQPSAAPRNTPPRMLLNGQLLRRSTP